MRTPGNITQLAYDLIESLGLDWETERAEDEIRAYYHLFDNYDRITEREYLALCEALWAEETDDPYPSDWKQGAEELIAEEDLLNVAAPE